MFESYITATEAAGYIKTFKGLDAYTAFNTLAAEDKTAALMGAQLIIDRQRFKGRKSDPDQVEAWPRVIQGQDVGVPEVVKLAQALQALTQATGQSEAEAMAESLKAAGITRYHLDDFDVSFDGTQDPTIKARDGLAEDVYKLLLPYLDRGGVAYVI